MKIAVTLPAEGPPEVIEAQRLFYAATGVEVLNEGSTDETTAEWLLEAGVGEFWWPRAKSLSDVFQSVPEGYDAVHAVVRHFIPLADADRPFVERTMFRLSPAAAITDPFADLRPIRKLAHRVTARSSARTLRGWYPLEVLRVACEGPAYDQDAIGRGLSTGVLVEDARLRDALRRAEGGDPVEFHRPNAIDDAEFALDIALLGEAEVLRAQARVDELEGRLAAVEATFPSMLKQKLRVLGRRSTNTP